MYKNHIKPIIGDIRIMQLSRQDLKRVILTAYSKELSEKSLKNIRGVLSVFCVFVYNSDIRLSCYAERDGRDWVGSSRIEPISENEARNFCKKYGDPEDYANYFPDLMQA